MTKTVLTGLALLVAASNLTVTAHASPRSERKAERGSRTVEVRYEKGSGFIPFVACFECPFYVDAKPGERYITVEVDDDLSPTGYVEVLWSTDGRSAYVVNVCGRTQAPERIPPMAHLELRPTMVPGPSCARGFSTSGTIKVTFSRHP